MDESPVPDTSSIKQDLVEFMRVRIRQVQRPITRQVMMPLLLEALTDRRVDAAIGGRMSKYPKPLLVRISRAVDAGQLRLLVDPARLLDLLIGTVVVPALFNLPTPDESEAESIVDQVLMGLTPR
jgi:hypothetical protein